MNRSVYSLWFLGLSLPGIAQREKEIRLVAAAAMSQEPKNQLLLDSAFTFSLNDCFPSIVSRLQLTSKDSACLQRQLLPDKNFRWRNHRPKNIPIVTTKEAKAPPYRNWIGLSKPVFLSKKKAIILLDTPNGGQVLYLEKDTYWQIQGAYCFYYY